MFLPPSPLPKAVPAAGRSRLQLTPVSLRFCHTHRGRHGLRRSPGCSDAHRTVDLSIKEFYTGDGPRHDHRFDCVRLRLSWHSNPSAVDDAPTSNDSNRYCTPAVDYEFGPGGAPRPSSRRGTTPLRPTAAAGSARRRNPCSSGLASPHGATIIPPRPHRAYTRPPLLRLTPSPGDTPTAHSRSDALGDAADIRFADSVARYSHAGWNREQHAKPTCHVKMRYVSIGGPSVLLPDVLACYPSHKRLFLSDIQELAGKGRLHITDEDIVLLVRNPTLPLPRSDKPNSVERAACFLNDEPVRIYVLLLVRPWIIQACHSTATCHLGTTRRLRVLDPFYW